MKLFSFNPAFSAKIRFIFLIWLSLLSLQPLFAQKKPRVALVLSGGGAKGIAHIGFLKVLEEAGIVPDIITGTSMGSIVGGLYAIGYTSEELEKIAIEANWKSLLANKVALRHVAIEEKEYYGRYIAELPVKNYKVELPKGLIEGQQLSALLSNLTRSVHDVEDFSKFPIPFACVATDITTGEPVVLNKGSLSESLRASMAIPSIFTPVSLDGHLLIDGGLVRNFPVQEALDMGADIVIGINVGTDLYSADNLNSLVSVLTQSAFVFSALDSREQKKSCHFLLEPDLLHHTTGSFESAREIIDLGEKAAREMYPQLKALADSLQQLGYVAQKPKKLPVQDSVFISKVSLRGNKQFSDKYIMSRLQIAENAYLSIADIEDKIQDLFGTRHFERITYQLKSLPDQQKELVLKITEDPSSKLKFAIHYDTENRIGINVNYTVRNNLIPNSRTLLEVDFAENPRAFFNFFKYLNAKSGLKPRYAFRLDGIYENNTIPLFDSLGNQNAAFRNYYFNISSGIQTTYHNNYTIGFKLQQEHAFEKVKVSGSLYSAIERISGYNTNAVLYFDYNEMNRPYFPTSGFRLRTELKRIFSTGTKIKLDEQFVIADSSAIRTLDFPSFTSFYSNFCGSLPLSKKLSISHQNILLLTSQTNLSFTDSYYVGGFNPLFRQQIPFWGTEPGRYALSQFLYANAMLQYNVYGKWYVQVLGNILTTKFPMSVLSLPYQNNQLSNRNSIIGYGISVGYDSFVGPLFISAANSRENAWTYNVSIGFYF